VSGHAEMEGSDVISVNRSGNTTVSALVCQCFQVNFLPMMVTF